MSSPGGAGARRAAAPSIIVRVALDDTSSSVELDLCSPLPASATPSRARAPTPLQLLRSPSVAEIGVALASLYGSAGLGRSGYQEGGDPGTPSRVGARGAATLGVASPHGIVTGHREQLPRPRVSPVMSPVAAPPPREGGVSTQLGSSQREPASFDGDLAAVARALPFDDVRSGRGRGEPVGRGRGEAVERVRGEPVGRGRGEPVEEHRAAVSGVLLPVLHAAPSDELASLDSLPAAHAHTTRVLRRRLLLSRAVAAAWAGHARAAPALAALAAAVGEARVSAASSEMEGSLASDSVMAVAWALLSSWRPAAAGLDLEAATALVPVLAHVLAVSGGLGEGPESDAAPADSPAWALAHWGPAANEMRHRALATLHLLLTAFRGVVAGTLAGARVPLSPSGLDAAAAAVTTAGEAREARCAALLVAWDAADAVLSARGGRLGDGDSATREYLQAYRSWRASPALARW